MPGLWSYSGAPYGLNDTKLAVNDLDGTFGTAVDVPSVQMLGVRFNTQNGQLEGDDAITVSQARIISATITLRMGGFSLDVLEAMGLGAVQSSDVTPDRSRRIKVSNRKMAYFGLCGRADASLGAGDIHLFIPMCKVMEGFDLKLEYGQFMIPELTCMAVPDSNFLDENGASVIVIPIEHESATAITLPPA